MDFLGVIASNSLLGALLAYTLWDNRELRKENKELYEKRLLDQKDNIKSLVDPLIANTDAMKAQKTVFDSIISILGKGKND